MFYPNMDGNKAAFFKNKTTFNGTKQKGELIVSSTRRSNQQKPLEGLVR